jgi:hypothetical protein
MPSQAHFTPTHPQASKQPSGLKVKTHVRGGFNPQPVPPG